MANLWDINDTSEIIDSVGGLIKKLGKISKEKNEFFFRGESRDFGETRLVPKAFRPPFKDKERELYYDAVTNFPQEFDNLSRLSKLAKMQHYGWPTRLLDLTSNPLIALYFACLDKDKIGYFYVLKTKKVLNYDSDKGLLLSCLSHLNSDQQESLYQFIFYCLEDKELVKYDGRITNKYMEINKPKSSEDTDGRFQFNRIIGEALRERPSFIKHQTIPIDLLSRFIVRPLIQNERQKKQDGLFLIFGLQGLEKDEKIDEQISKNERWIDISCYQVKNKKKILNELDLLGINDATIFCDIESRAKFHEKLAKANCIPAKI